MSDINEFFSSWRKFKEKFKKSGAAKSTTNPPKEDFETWASTAKAAPPKERPAISIDPDPALMNMQQRSPEHIASMLNKLDNDIQSMYKSDSTLNLPKLYGEFGERLTKIDRELTYAEGAKTMTPAEVEKERRRLESFRQILATSDTVDVDLFRLKREIDKSADTVATTFEPSRDKDEE